MMFLMLLASTGSSSNIWSILGGLAGGLAIATFLYHFFGKLFSQAVEAQTTKQTNSIEEKFDEKLRTALKPIYAELSANGGGSTKDQARFAAENSMDLTRKFQKHKKQTNKKLGKLDREIRRLWTPDANPPIIPKRERGTRREVDR